MTNSVPEERRAKYRFPISCPVTFCEITEGKHSKFSRPTLPYLPYTGRTLNISSSGLLIRTETRLAVGTYIDLRIDWPFLLDGAVNLHLAVRARVVRELTGVGFAAMFREHQFKTGRNLRVEGVA